MCCKPPIPMAKMIRRTLAAGIYATGGEGAFTYDATGGDEGKLPLTATGEVVMDGGGAEQSRCSPSVAML